MSLPPSSAPTATGWSDSCRAGFAPAEEWRLVTAHRKIRAGAQADSETGHANLETAQGATPRSDARGRPRDGAMAGEGSQRLAELLCRADQFPDP